jgi:CheY-like chemotaxis protein
VSTLHRIALLGFSAFERNTLASYLRLASTRQPRYEQVQMLPEADFVVADADHEPSVQLVVAVERMPETVFVGAQAPAGAVAWLARPIDPMRVLRELDALAMRRMSAPAAAGPRAGAHAAASAAASAGSGAGSGAGMGAGESAADLADAERRRTTVIQPVRPVRPLPPPHMLLQPEEMLDLTLPDLPDPPDLPAAAAAPVAARSVPAAAASPVAPPLVSPPASQPVSPPVSARALPAAPGLAAVPGPRAAASMPLSAAKAAAPRPIAPVAALATPAVPSTALLVDDSDLALRFLERKLAPFGLVTESVSHSEAAMERLQNRRYDFVFLDMELGERSPLDGLSLCQRIKREPASANVVMVTAHHTELDRVRGALAGCDGFLGKPLDEDELALYLARFGVRPAVNAGRAPS